MKRLLILFILVMMIGLVTPSQDSLGTYKQGEDVILLQICGTCSYNNITSIVLPNSTHLEIDTEMTKRGVEYTYTFNQTNLPGTYSVNGFGDLDGTANAWAYNFMVTPTGSEKPTTSEGIIIVISILVMVLFSLFFFMLGMKIDSGIGSLICVAISGVLLFTTVMFTITIVSDNLQHLGSAMQGYETFLLIIKTIISISVTTLVLYGMYKALTIWGLKRGLITE